MKRKIAAIFAADIAGYSRLVAEDEEETLRRLASYRQVTDDFIARYGGRIFNTAGDAVLAEFPSAVEAVRCAIDIQESLRTRNMAYPASRQMSFRIGITIGDVVERDGDLLGDGVNIAARLEGLAEVGGICISRAVHEQVANKLSVQFADIGAQEVKNIPNPVHAYLVAMRREDGTYATPQVKKPLSSPPAASPNWMWPLAVTVVCLVAIGVGGFPVFYQDGNAGRAERSFRRQPPRHACTLASGNFSSNAICRTDDGRTGFLAASFAAAATVGRKVCRRDNAVRHRPDPSHLGDRVRSGVRSQGYRPQRQRLHRARYRPAERRNRKERRARAVPEKSRRGSVAAKMRDLRCRQYGGLSAWPSAVAAAAMDQARSVNREAIRVEGYAVYPRSRKSQA